MRVILLALVVGVAAEQYPETGGEMSWGDANRAFSDSIKGRDYDRLSTSLDAADQFAGFRPAERLTKGVPFAKVPPLTFEGFALGKMDNGIDSYVRQMTPYLAASHYQNRIRTPKYDNFIYPQTTTDGVIPSVLNPMAPINMAFSRNGRQNDSPDEPDLEQVGVGASTRSAAVQGMMPPAQPVMPGMSLMQAGGNPYALPFPTAGGMPGGMAGAMPGGLPAAMAGAPMGMF
jgi:hypothetical protein